LFPPAAPGGGKNFSPAPPGCWAPHPLLEETCCSDGPRTWFLPCGGRPKCLGRSLRSRAEKTLGPTNGFSRGNSPAAVRRKFRRGPKEPREKKPAGPLWGFSFKTPGKGLASPKSPPRRSGISSGLPD